jgi:sortase A
VALSVIDLGPAHWVGTAGPGEAGNVVIAAHRSTHGAPFRDLDELRPGDHVYLTDRRGFDVMYRVAETFIVEPDEVWITYPTSEPVLTMFACHPHGSAAQRIVVRADLVAGRLIA